MISCCVASATQAPAVRLQLRHLTTSSTCRGVGAAVRAHGVQLKGREKILDPRPTSAFYHASHTMTKTVPFAQYLFRRLHQANCHSVHGVPGDFMLRALDLLNMNGQKIERIPRWIGNANELCAGYAADGYVRAAALARRNMVSGPKVGAVFTTYGVGELSAINAIAGSCAESVPVVHLVGTPCKAQWRNSPGACIHHTLGDGRLHVYAEMAKQITCAQADLSCDDIGEAAERYDSVLGDCIRQSKPVYVNVPTDVLTAPVPAKWLERCIKMDNFEQNLVEEDRVASIILDRLKFADRPLIIADGLAYQWNMGDEVNELVQPTSIPATCFSAGKGLVDESLPSWIGPLASPTDYSESTDLSLLFGPLLSDTNTAAWTAIPKPSISVSFNLDTVAIGSKSYAVRGRPVLQKLITKLRAENFVKQIDSAPLMSNSEISYSSPTSSSLIGQDQFWSRLSRWLRADDTILLANGTPLIGGRDMHLPDRVQVIASGIWCSIGHMLPAAQGVAAAKRDHAIPGRTILFEGDGSFQVTCQSISDIIRYKLDVTIFICNNAGYTYERLLHGFDAEYNDVPAWRYVDAAMFMGGNHDDPEYGITSRRIQTWRELEDTLMDCEIANGRGLKVIDIMMGPGDVPQAARAGLKKAGDALRAT